MAEGMNDKLKKEIEDEQAHGRCKYGLGPEDFSHDDIVPNIVWHNCIDDHNKRAEQATPMDRRQHLIKVAGLAISALEAFDRRREKA